MNENIWTPYKIWNETQWFSNFEKISKEFQRRNKNKHGEKKSSKESVKPVIFITSLYCKDLYQSYIL